MPAATRLAVASKSLPLLRDFGLLNALVGLSHVAQRVPFAKKLDTATISFLAASSAGQYCSIHPILDNAAWSIFLQSALVLGLWAGENIDAAVNIKTEAKNIQWTNYLPMLLAFSFGTIGSLVGGFASFHIATTLFPSYDMSHSSLVAASLTASYVGGTANFFDTASLLGGFSTVAKTKLLKLVAGVDIAVMVLYFWALTTVRNSPILRCFLSPAHEASSHSTISATTSSSTPTDTQLIELVPSPSITQSVLATQTPYRQYQSVINPLSLANTLLPLSAAVTITTVAQKIQTFCTVPGVSVMFSVLSAVFFMRIWKRMLTNPPATAATVTAAAAAVKTAAATEAETAAATTTASTTAATTTVTATAATTVSNSMSSFCSHSQGASVYMLSLFYATIGIGARMSELPSVGRPLLTIIGTLLGVHFTTLLLLSSLWNMCVRRWVQWNPKTTSSPLAIIIDVDTAVIASNACVGGAATAAQMAAAFLVPTTTTGTDTPSRCTIFVHPLDTLGSNF